MKAIRYGVLVLVVGVWVGPAAGRWRGYNYLPAERLIQNATAYIAEEPNDASGYFTLGRIHYLAFANQAFLVAAREDFQLPTVMPYWWDKNYLEVALRTEAMQRAVSEYGIDGPDDLPSAETEAFFVRVGVIYADLKRGGWKPAQPTSEELIAHAGAAQWNFYQAIALDPNNALYTLGLASLGEQYLEFFAEAGGAPLPPALRMIALDAVKETYLLAYKQSVEQDLTLERLPLEGLRGIISYEAGSAFVRLWEGEEAIAADVQETIATIKANLATFEALPTGAITPIVFSLESRASLAELLTTERIVSFDLDGDGRAERRPWVKPTTAFLVWDADTDGKITSGREMFGSVTWWMFFPNGYRALDVLDDSRNGWLEAGELKGISAWFDRNSNGISDAGELASLESLGISAIATRAAGHEGRSPMCNAGLRLRDGRALPTYDWIAPAAVPVEVSELAAAEDDRDK